MIEMTLKPRDTSKLSGKEKILKNLEWKYNFHMEQAQKVKQQIDEIKGDIYGKQ